MIEALNNFCRKLGVSPSELVSDSLKQPLPLYRAIFSYLMYPEYTQTEIGRLLNRRSSAIYKGIHRLKGYIAIRDKQVYRLLGKLGLNVMPYQIHRPDLIALSKTIYELHHDLKICSQVCSDKYHLCMIVGELIDTVRAYKDNKRGCLFKFNYSVHNIAQFKRSFETHIINTVEDKFALAVIHLLDLAAARHYDLNEIAFKDQSNSRTFTESVWDVIFELVACTEEEAVYCGICQIETLCNRLSIELWEYVELRIKYHKLNPSLPTTE